MNSPAPDDYNFLRFYAKTTMLSCSPVPNTQKLNDNICSFKFVVICYTVITNADKWIKLLA